MLQINFRGEHWQSGFMNAVPKRPGVPESSQEIKRKEGPCLEVIREGVGGLVVIVCLNP